MKRFSGSPVPRLKVFVLADGMSVVQWGDTHVQELLTGRYRAYDHKRDFGHRITDFELKQLKAAGRLEHFNRANVWLYALPEKGRFANTKVLGRGDRVRVYYVSSSIPQEYLDEVQAMLRSVGLGDDLKAETRENNVIFLAGDGTTFQNVRDAENAQVALTTKVGNDLGNLSIAFVETRKRELNTPPRLSFGTELNLNEIIASQEDTSAISGKRILLALRQVDERLAFNELLTDKMKLDVKHTTNGNETLQKLEECLPDLLLVDIQLADMHAWELLRGVKEIPDLRDMPVLVLMEQRTVIPVNNAEPVFRPVSMAKLRQTIWLSLKDLPPRSPALPPC